MTEIAKKKYQRPEVKRVSLDARTSVLGACKTGTAGNPGKNTSNCKVFAAPCSALGS